MELRFSLTLDVQEALYTALGSADLSGLGPDEKTNYVVTDATVTRINETSWNFTIDIDRTNGEEVNTAEIVQALTEYLDGELCVDIGVLEER